MADITMCRGVMQDGSVCEKANKCYRYTATASPFWQSFFTTTPLCKETKQCEFFWNNEEK